MKKSIIAVLMVFGLTAGTTAYAQESTGTHERPTTDQIAKRRAERMTEKLGLDSMQARKVYALTFIQVKEAEQQRKTMHKKRTSQAEKLQEILTPEQMTQWEQMRNERPKSLREMADKRGKMEKSNCKKEGKGCCDKKGDKKEGKGCCKKGDNKPCRNKNKR